MMFSADQIVLTNLNLSCYVNKPNHTKMDVHQTDETIAVDNMTSNSYGGVYFHSWCRDYSLSWDLGKKQN